MSENNRILFVINRDGLEEAINWAKRTRSIYRTAVLDKTHHASLREYRKTFIESYLILKRFINNHGN